MHLNGIKELLVIGVVFLLLQLWWIFLTIQNGIKYETAHNNERDQIEGLKRKLEDIFYNS